MIKDILDSLEAKYKKELNDLIEASWNRRALLAKLDLIKEIKREIRRRTLL